MPGKKKTPKPRPISKKIARPPAKAAPKKEVAEGINNVSPITAKQIARAERGIDNLREEVKELRNRKPEIKVSSPEPKVVVNIPPRPRIARVKVKYDNFGVPSEFIPQYEEVAV